MAEGWEMEGVGIVVEVAGNVGWPVGPFCCVRPSVGGVPCDAATLELICGGAVVEGREGRTAGGGKAGICGCWSCRCGCD